MAAKKITLALTVNYLFPCILDDASDKFKPEPHADDVIAKIGESLKLAQRVIEVPDDVRMPRLGKARDQGHKILDAERNVRFLTAIQDITANGYLLAEAYWQHKHEHYRGVPTARVFGRCYCFEFVPGPADEQAAKRLEALALAVERFDAPSLVIWGNPDDTQAINVGHAFQRHDPRPSGPELKILRFRQGEFVLEPDNG